MPALNPYIATAVDLQSVPPSEGEPRSSPWSYALHYAAFSTTFVLTVFVAFAIGWSISDALSLLTVSPVELVFVLLVTLGAWLPHLFLMLANKRVRRMNSLITGTIGAFVFVVASQAVEFFVQHTSNRLSTAISRTSEFILLPSYAMLSVIVVIAYCYSCRRTLGQPHQ